MQGKLIAMAGDGTDSATVLGFDAAIFDLDGVITFTAHVHAAAWKELFDEYLRSRETRFGEPFRPFTDADYRAYVDGRPRYEGVRTFLASRGIAPPYGDPSDPPDAETVCGLGNRKDLRFRDRLQELGVEVDHDAVRFIRELRERDVRVGIASSSRNTELVLDRADLTSLFDARVDGVVSARLGLEGKPAPDIFLECLKRLGASDPRRAIVAEDAAAGVEAGRAGGFGCVLGIDRGGQAIALREHGADWVVRDFREVTAERVRAYFEDHAHARPNAIARWADVVRELGDRTPAIVLDWDVALAPAAARPGGAVLADDMRDALRRLAAAAPTTVVIGHDREAAAALAGLEGVRCAQRHGVGILRLLDAPELDRADVAPLYVGGDSADEDAFRALESRGIGILVAELPRPTTARYSLQDTVEARELMERLTMLEVRRSAGSVVPVAPTSDPTWRLVEEGFDLAREHEVESLFAVSNGYVGTRASLAEGSRLSSPATFIAGIFDRSPDQGSIPALVALPDWTRLRVAVDGHELRLERGDLLAHRRVLDLRQGILWRELRHRDPSGRVSRVRGLRLASLADRHLLLQSIDFTTESYNGRLGVESRIDGPVPDSAPSPTTPPEPALVILPGEAKPTGTGAVVLALRTESTGHVIVFAAAGALEGEGPEPVERKVEIVEQRPIEWWEIDAESGRTYRLNRLVAVHTSRDTDRTAETARAHVDRLRSEDFERVLADHVAAWAERWRATDVEIDGDDDAQRALRFACYHLIGAANPEDERVSVGARMLTGGAYKGHVFWDTEIYMVPFYNLTHPASARALLAYRHHTLPAAREKARAGGWRGALYPWESADTGEETTPPFAIAPDGTVVPIRNGEQEHHISADIAYAVWQYWACTGDDEFLLDAGAEILLESARFWASRGELGADGRYHIRHVIGPDEYHEDVDDSAYTNVMAQWNLERGVEAARFLEERWPARWRTLADAIGLEPNEPDRWSEIAAAMYTGFDPATGLFEQFHGYFDLEEVELAAYEPRTAPMDVLLGHERIQQTKVIKQADVVLLLYLLWDRFPPEVREANFRYYEPRCGHGSSLSPSIHALVAARLGDVTLAERYFRQSAEIDLANNMGNAAGGVHAAALGGLWQAVVFGFAGLRFGPDGPVLDAHLPRTWRGLQFPVQWRGRTARMSVGRESRQEITP